MRQTDTKPLMRLITDEVEMAILHSTIWGTVHKDKKLPHVKTRIIEITWGNAKRTAHAKSQYEK